ncbi:cellulase family glycosylhydrolase, partial [candidate division WWE3 bacterium]|nr:cellulase family glycosylhydrolase [candidate division WWE3 bacterium]
VVVIILPVFLFILWRPKPIDHINYGITYSNKYATELGLDWRETYLAILDDLKVPHLRLVAYWDEVEPQNDQYDFSTIRWQLDEAKQRNIPVIMILGRKQVRYPECFEPEWWKSIDDEATQDAELFDYIKNTMNNLKEYDNIVMWQVENEPFFPFGTCAGEIKWSTLNKEVAIVRQLDSRPIIIQDSGEGGVWLPTYLAGDYLAISMYRRIWYDFWGLIFGKPIYFQYPLAHWTYKIKAELTHVPYEKIFVTELQAEPWGPAISSKLTREEKDKTMSRELFIDTINYAQKAGFENLYFWGAEWWYFEKTQLNEPFFWDTAKALFN